MSRTTGSTRRGSWAALLALLLAGMALPESARAAESVSVRATSPDGSLAVEVTTNGEGRPEYRLLRQGQPVLETSRLGFLLANAPKLERNLAIESLPWFVAYQQTLARNGLVDLYDVMRDTTSAMVAPA